MRIAGWPKSALAEHLLRSIDRDPCQTGRVSGLGLQEDLDHPFVAAGAELFLALILRLEHDPAVFALPVRHFRYLHKGVLDSTNAKGPAKIPRRALRICEN